MPPRDPKLSRYAASSYLKTRYSDFPFQVPPFFTQSNQALDHEAGFKAHPLKVFAVSTFYSWAAIWQKFTSVYSALNLVPHCELYLRARKAKHLEVRHYLQFKFKGSKLSINLLDIVRKRTHISITPGLFLKYFQNKKSLKKNKSMKILMVKFLRKLLLVLKLKNVIVLSRGVPVYLELLLSTLFRPLSHPFTDPIAGSIIDETQDEKNNINVSSIMFINIKPFGSQKAKKKGRVKRKIRRKLVRLNSVID